MSNQPEIVFPVKQRITSTGNPEYPLALAGMVDANGHPVTPAQLNSLHNELLGLQGSVADMENVIQQQNEEMKSLRVIARAAYRDKNLPAFERGFNKTHETLIGLMEAYIAKFGPIRG